MRASRTVLCIRAAVLVLPLAVACASTDNGGNGGTGGGDDGGGGGSNGGSTGGGSNGGSNGGSSGTGGSSGSKGGSSSGTSGSGGSNSGGSSGSNSGGSSGTGSSSGSGGSSGTGSNSSSGSGGDGGSSNPDGSVNVDGGTSMCGTPAATVISDFEQGSGVMIKQGGRSGWWYVSDDGTGTQTPASVAAGPIAVAAAPSDDKTLMGETCNKYALHSTSSGQTTWGAVVGGTFVPGTGTNKSAYDVSMYDGIQFDIKTGAASQGSLYFEVVTKESQASMYGGTASTNSHVDLNNNRGQILSASGTANPSGTSTAIPTTMTTVYVPFSLLVPRWFPQPGNATCGSTTCTAPAFVPANALGFQFSTYPDFASTLGYDLWVDNVALYTGDTGLTPPGYTMPTFKDGSTGWSCTKPTFLGGKSAAGKYLLWAYRNWKTNFVRENGSTTTLCTSSSSSCIVMSPEVQGGSVVSEGIAYGMLIAAYMGDQTLFDKLHAYWNANAATGHLMTWIFGQNGSGSKGSGSATDADEDAAWALHVASKVFSGGTYAADATNIINDIWTSDFDHTSSLPTFGSNGGGSTANSGVTNPSYFAPAYYPTFAATNSAFTGAISAAYTALGNMAGLGTLPPAWCSGNCTTAGGGGYANATDYQYDAHRVPWRVGVDFCWNGSTSASGALSKISQFFNGQFTGGSTTGIDNLYDEYQTSGGVCTGCSPAAQPNSMSLVGTAAVGALAGGSSYSGFVNAGWQFVLDGLNRGQPNTQYTGNNYYTYFNTTVGLLTALTMSGNFYKL